MTSAQLLDHGQRLSRQRLRTNRYGISGSQLDFDQKSIVKQLYKSVQFHLVRRASFDGSAIILSRLLSILT